MRENFHRQLTGRVTSIVIDAICRWEWISSRRRRELRPMHVRRDGRRYEVFEKAGVDDRRSWKIEVEEKGERGLAIFHGVLVARKGFQRRTVLPEAVLQTRDKGSPVPRFRRREAAAAAAAAKALVSLLHLSLATWECGGNRRKESREQTPSGCYAVSLFLPLASPSPSPSTSLPAATVNSVNICLSCLIIRLSTVSLPTRLPSARCVSSCEVSRTCRRRRRCGISVNARVPRHAGT